MDAEDRGPGDGWTFLTNHAHILVCVARHPDVRIRNLAACAGITERAVQRILSELVGAGYLTKHRLGRRNFYEIQPHKPLRHPVERGHVIGELLTMLVDRDGTDEPRQRVLKEAADQAPRSDPDAGTR